MRHPTIVLTAVALCLAGFIYLYNRRLVVNEYFNNPPLQIYLHGFWSDVHQNIKNKIINMCEIAFSHKCEISPDSSHNDIIVQSVFTNDHDIVNKFKYKIFLTGENYKNENAELYDVCLVGEHTQGKYVAFPFFLFYLEDDDIKQLQELQSRHNIPKKDVLVIISNPGGVVRNKFLNELDKHFNITYAGSYKNNIGGKLPYSQNSQEFKDYVRDFKFIITMENSEAPHYITEKILQGMRSQIVPIYWGGSEASRYFNKDRFIQLRDGSDESIRSVIELMKDMIAVPSTWLAMVNRPVFAGSSGQLDYTTREIGEQMRTVFKKSGLIV